MSSAGENGPSREKSRGSRRSWGAGAPTQERGASYRYEISEFCAAIRVGRPLRCGPEKAIGSAVACLAAHQAIQKKARIVLA